jgi:hypothetical protein
VAAAVRSILARNNNTMRWPECICRGFKIWNKNGCETGGAKRD